jgi:S1-C subfamily serine protease
MEPSFEKGILSVGEGRGFVVESLRRSRRYVVTCAHCLPSGQELHGQGFSSAVDRTFFGLLHLPGEQTTAAAECLFVDPISDVAVLGAPDHQDLTEEYRKFLRLMESVIPLTIANVTGETSAWLLSLEGEWFTCKVERDNQKLWLSDPAQPIAGNMSGSPIVNNEGAAIGVLGSADLGSSDIHNISLQTFLPQAIPLWLAIDILEPKILEAITE